ALVKIEDGAAQKKALDDLIEAQYENGNKGALLGAYREARMRNDEMGAFSAFEPDSAASSALEGTVKNTRPRMVDGVAELTDDLKGLPSGRYAFEDKAGASWNAKQAQDYIDHMNANGGKLVMKDGNVMDGLVYFAQDKKHAEYLRDKLSELDAPSNVRVSFLTNRGELALL